MAPIPVLPFNRIGRFGMTEEIQEFVLNLGSSATKITIGQCVEQFRLRLIVEAILARSGYLTGIKIIVGQLQSAGSCLA